MKILKGILHLYVALVFYHGVVKMGYWALYATVNYILDFYWVRYIGLLGEGAGGLQRYVGLFLVKNIGLFNRQCLRIGIWTI
jgi:hypothetical protein